MSKFVPVVDQETPRSERNDDAESMRKHRQFDNPFSMAHVKRDGAGSSTGRSADRGGWDRGKGWDRGDDARRSNSGDSSKAKSAASSSQQQYPKSKLAKKRKTDANGRISSASSGYGSLHLSASSASSSLSGNGKRRRSSGANEEEEKQKAALMSAKPQPTYEVPDIKPIEPGVDGWERYQGTPLLHSEARGLLYDSRSATYFKIDETTGELVMVSQNSSTEDVKDEAEFIPEVLFGSDSWVGRKENNEDRVTEDQEMGPLGRYFGLYDGHAGYQCADFIVQHLHKNILHCFNQSAVEYTMPPLNSDGLTAIMAQEASVKQLIECKSQLKQLQELPSSPEIDATKEQLSELIVLTQAQVELAEEATSTANRSNKKFEQAVSKAIKDGHYLTDQSYLSIARKKKSQDFAHAGSTSVGVFIQGKAPDDVRVICPNAGDSRAILCRQGKAVALTEDHKPDRVDEKKRIRRAGGDVIDAGGIARIASRLALAGGKDTVFLSVARAFGDISLKEPDPLVTSEPDIEVRHVLPGDNAIIMGCDGIWDVLSNQDAVNIYLENVGRPKEAASAIVRAAYKQGSEDNITVTVIEFPWARAPLPEVEEVVEEPEVIVSTAVDDDLDMFAD